VKKVPYEESTVKFKLCHTESDREGKDYKLIATSPTIQLPDFDGEW
jgi:hypothetical protein